MATKNDRINLRLDEELAEATKMLAESEGVTVADIARRALRNEVMGGHQDGAQDASAQLDRIEANMEVLYHGMVALVERQEQGMRALASGIKSLADAPAKQPPALPEAKQPMTEADYWREYRKKRKEQGVNVIVVR